MTSLKTASLAEIREIAARICRDYLTGQWKTITAEDIVVKRISGGLSNFLYYISLPPQDSSNSPASSPIRNFEKTTQTQTQQQTNDQTPQTLCDKVRTDNNSYIKRNLPREIDNGNNDNTRKRQRTDSGEIISNSPTSSSGGFMHNAMQEKEPREVMLRIYGNTHGENALEAMITESVVFALLSERNFGPKLHGIFPGGRIEQYIPARALLITELSDHKISMKIAEKMGEIHSLNIPMSKEPDWLWNCMERWIKSISNVFKSVQGKDPGINIDEVRSFDFPKERKWLKSVIDSQNYPVLFCHNDMQEGNILLRKSEQSSVSTQVTQNSFSSLGLDDNSVQNNEDPNGNDKKSIRANANTNSNNTGNSTSIDYENTRDSVLSNTSEDNDPDLKIIDFEYCAYNYRGFDLANHFLEWTIDNNYPEFPFYSFNKSLYPTQRQRYDFIAAYLKKLNESVELYVPSESEIQAVDEEVRIFSMFSHLFWSLWSVVNVNSSIEFGYWQYAITRIQEYKKLKQNYLLKQ